MSFNKIFMVGNLGHDPELRSLPAGTSVCNFNVAINDSYRGKKDVSDRTPTWFRVAVFGQRATSCAKKLKKGSQVYVAGRLRTREWEDSQGIRHHLLEVIATDVRFFGTAESRTIRIP